MQWKKILRTRYNAESKGRYLFENSLKFHSFEIGIDCQNDKIKNAQNELLSIEEPEGEIIWNY